jgi:hypothetical protein
VWDGAAAVRVPAAELAAKLPDGGRGPAPWGDELHRRGRDGQDLPAPDQPVGAWGGGAWARVRVAARVVIVGHGAAR